MRKGHVWYILLTVLALTMWAPANLLDNPGFEEGTAWIPLNSIPGWSSWGSNGGIHNNPGQTLDAQAAMLWWTDSGIFQDFPVTAGHTYRFSGYMFHPANDPLRNGDKTGELHAEWYTESALLLGEDVFGVISKSDPNDEWLFYTADLTAPAGAVTGRYLIRMYQPSAGDGVVSYDNVSVYDAALYGQAYDPEPTNGATVDLNLNTLSWKSHDPEDVFTYDVYLEPDDGDPNFASAPIAAGITDTTVNLSSAGVTLMDNTVYTWRVETTDPNDGGAVVFPGVVWTFQIGDVVAVVDAGANQYNWIYMEDGDGDSAKVTFTVTGTYTDDAKSDIVRAEWVQGTHEGGGTVTIESQNWTPGTGTHSSGTVEAVVSATGNGWLVLTLEVEDAIGTSSDTMNAGVYNTCLEAALEDPSDNTIESNWANGHGDIDGDCDTDLEDFAILASSWAECMTIKAGCTP